MEQLNVEKLMAGNHLINITSQDKIVFIGINLIKT